jgi:hypothetical protein
MWSSASSNALRVLLLATATVAVASSASAVAGAGTGSAGPVVQSMIVGRGGSVLFAPRALSVSAAVMHVGRRRCNVAAATPLAVLSAARTAGGPSFSLHDYGHCGASPANAAQLFVNRVGPDRNGGQSGWEYKVGHVAGTTGAADTSGAAGNGRLLGYGERVLWFWCNSTAGGCQRTLDFAPSVSTIALGAAFTVKVSGYDNSGRGAVIAGATVTLGSGRKRGVTGADGVVRLTAPKARGTYALNASKGGLVPAFPGTIVVR